MKNLSQEVIEVLNEVNVPRNALWFEVSIRDGGSRASVRLTKVGGKWKEIVLDNEDDVNIGGKTYQSYLKPADILTWLRGDFDDVQVTSFDDVSNDDEEQDESLSEADVKLNLKNNIRRDIYAIGDGIEGLLNDLIETNKDRELAKKVANLGNAYDDLRSHLNKKYNWD